MYLRDFSCRDFENQRMSWCFAPENDLLNELSFRGFSISAVAGEGPFEPDGVLAFLDRSADVLAVAHMDTVYDPTEPIILDGMICSSGVDNRFGVYVAAELLHEKGIHADVLFTTNEERCMSTARHFAAPQGKKYNWLVEFDRRGAGAALYQYQHDAEVWCAALNRVGLCPVVGTYSDIADLSHLGCKALNLGIGYCDNVHSPDAWLDLDLAVEQLNRFACFYRRNHRRWFVHDPGDGFRFETLLL